MCVCICVCYTGNHSVWEGRQMLGDNPLAALIPNARKQVS
jgi:hypothetical protein